MVIPGEGVILIMSQFPDRVIHQSSSQTLNQAMRVLYSVTLPILRYRQHLSTVTPNADISYYGLIKHDRENHLLTIQFPTELVGIITGIKNSHNCRMVSYVKHPVTEFIQEIQVNHNTEINCLHRFYEPVLRIYTGGVENLTVSFDVYLFKTMFYRSRL